MFFFVSAQCDRTEFHAKESISDLAVALKLKVKILGGKEMLPTTTAIRKSGFGTLLKVKYIFEVQRFAGSSVVEIPTCV